MPGGEETCQQIEPGRQVTVRVLDIDDQRHRISLRLEEFDLSTSAESVPEEFDDAQDEDTPGYSQAFQSHQEEEAEAAEAVSQSYATQEIEEGSSLS
jgi:predicted RNA-binding protein with RPS1 domain